MIQKEKQERIVRMINYYFEKAFMENKFDILLLEVGYRKTLKKIFEHSEFSELTDSEKEMFYDNCIFLVGNLPIYRLFSAYRGIFVRLYGGSGAWQEKEVTHLLKNFKYNPFTRAILILGNLLRRDAEFLNFSRNDFSQEFIETYFSDEIFNLDNSNDLERKLAKFYYIEYDEETRQIQASNWYKLSYICANVIQLDDEKTLFQYYLFTDNDAVRNRIMDVSGAMCCGIVDIQDFVRIRNKADEVDVRMSNVPKVKADRWTIGLCYGVFGSELVSKMESK